MTRGICLSLLERVTGISACRGVFTQKAPFSAGYPGDYSAGKTITRMYEVERLDGVVVFHDGTKINADGEIETAGGRVLGVTARAATLGEATSRAYEAVGIIQFDGMQYRKDIGAPRKQVT